MTASTKAQINKVTALLHQPFEIVLPSQSTSGYEWQPQFKSTCMRLVTRRHVRAKSGNFGAFGQEIFKFEPLKPGDHSLKFNLKRPFEKKPAEKRAFSLHVS